VDTSGPQIQLRVTQFKKNSKRTIEYKTVFAKESIALVFRKQNSREKSENMMTTSAKMSQQDLQFQTSIVAIPSRLSSQQKQEQHSKLTM